MSHTNYIATINALATLDIDALASDRERAAYIKDAAAQMDVSENHLIEIIKTERAAFDALSHAEQCKLANAMWNATLTCALFNARRCYHARLDIAA